MHSAWLALVLSIAGYGVSHACTHPPERVAYAIQHETYGDVGRHVITFSCQGDDLVVDTKINGEVAVLACRSSSAWARIARCGAATA